MLFVEKGIVIRVSAVLTLRKAFTLNVQVTSRQRLITSNLWLGGGDLTGILYLMPQGGVWTLFGLILIYNLWLLIKKVTPVYSEAFNKN